MCYEDYKPTKFYEKGYSRVGRAGVTKGTVTLYITSLGLSSVCFRCLVNGHRKWVVSCVLGIGDVTAAKDVM